MTKSKSSALFCAAISLLMPFAPAAWAQFDGPYPNFAPDNMNAMMSSHIAGLSLENVVGGNTRKKQSGVGTSGGRTSRGKTATPRPQAMLGTGAVQAGSTQSATTSYRRDPAVSKRVINQFVAWARTRSPKEADFLKTTFARHDAVQVWQGIVKEDGLKTGDVADALASYWILNYLIATGGTSNTATQAAAVREQVKPLIAGNPTFARLSSAQRQELAETWMVNFVVQQGAYGTAMKNQNKDFQKKLAAAAVARFQNEMGLDLRKLKLTEKGFTMRA